MWKVSLKLIVKDDGFCFGRKLEKLGFFGVGN